MATAHQMSHQHAAEESAVVAVVDNNRLLRLALNDDGLGSLLHLRCRLNQHGLSADGLVVIAAGMKK